jgi:enoyl-CoA hydratase
MRGSGAVECEHLLTESRRGVGRITLNRPAKYNALTLAMVREMQTVLAHWAGDGDVHFVMIDGAGERGLCAGGDLTVLIDSARAQDGRALEFWAQEYRLNATIAAYCKPIVAFMSGTVMGGGVGLSAHARYRIVTSTTQIAMPEARIGLIPDVGATWLLSRTPGETGTYLGLTGAPIGAADALQLGLADYFVPAHAIEELVATLLAEGPQSDDEIRALVERFSAPVESRLAARRERIDRAFAYDAVESILSALAGDGSQWARATAREIRSNSPTSVKLTLRALRAARGLASLEECLRLEYGLMRRLLDEHDFREGVRATVLDKDRAPRWRPADFSEISDARIDDYFSSLHESDLQL